MLNQFPPYNDEQIYTVGILRAGLIRYEIGIVPQLGMEISFKIADLDPHLFSKLGQSRRVRRYFYDSVKDNLYKISVAKSIAIIDGNNEPVEAIIKTILEEILQKLNSDTNKIGMGLLANLNGSVEPNFIYFLAGQIIESDLPFYSDITINTAKRHSFYLASLTHITELEECRNKKDVLNLLSVISEEMESEQYKAIYESPVTEALFQLQIDSFQAQKRGLVIMRLSSMIIKNERLSQFFLRHSTSFLDGIKLWIGNNLGLNTDELIQYLENRLNHFASFSDEDATAGSNPTLY